MGYGRRLKQYMLIDSLRRSGLQCWRIFSDRCKMAGMIYVACNRLKPEDPYCAYKSLERALDRYQYYQSKYSPNKCSLRDQSDNSN